METEIESYLCKSVLVQKGLPKLLIVYQGERSQDGAVMCRREEAGQSYFGGCRVGLHVARASALCAKREFPASEELPEGCIRLSSPAFAGKWRCHPKKMAREFDRRSPTLSPASPGVRLIYKASSKMVGLSNGEEKSSLLASSLRMAADPEYLLLEGKGKTSESKEGCSLS
jgi:hypothetical protein